MHEDKDEFIGDEVNQMSGVLKISYPIEHGIIKDWDDIEKIWDQIFYEVL